MHENKASKDEKKYTTKGILLGIFLAFLCNLVYLTTSILVKQYRLLSAEICFIRGILQVSVFAAVYVIINSWRKCVKSEKGEVTKEQSQQSLFGDQTSGTLETWKLTIIVCLCGISFAVMTLLAYIGVKLLPLSDFIVLGHTAPVFTLLLSALILR